MAPIIIAKHKKTNKEYWFYSNNEWDKIKEKFNSKIFDIEYYKGLGSLEDHHYERLIRKPKLIKFKFKEAEKFMKTVEIWFGKSAQLRKDELMYDGEAVEFDTDF